MLIKFTTKTILLILILTSLMLYSCFEEPIIEPVKQPYSSVRIGNFSYNQPGFAGNIDRFNVFVDGVSKGSVDINTFSGYFDLTSGSRRFVLTSGSDTIFAKSITINSYEEISVIFDGVYAPGVDTLMSFAPYSLTDGVVYLLESPIPGKVKIVTSNLAPNTETENQIKYSLSFISTTFDTTIRNLYEYNKSFGLNAPAGDYTIWVLQDTTTNLLATKRQYDTLANFAGTFVAGMRENLFIIGEPKSPMVLKEQQIPLAVRPK